MKKTLLSLTATACLATAGVATVFADKATTSPGPETIRGQGGAITDMDEVGRDASQARSEAGPEFKRLDTSNDGFLNAQELNRYGASSSGEARSSQNTAASQSQDSTASDGAAVVQELDRDGNSVVTPDEFRAGQP